MRRLASILLVASAAILVAVGCAAAPRADLSEARSADGLGYGEPALAPMPPPEEPAAPPKEAVGYAWGDEEAARVAYWVDDALERMVIRTANLSIVVKDTDEALDSVRAMVKGYGGYVADSNQWYSAEQLYAEVTLRVPSESLDALLDDLAELAVRVESQRVSGDDVTEEYVDLQARLRNLEATEEELRALLTEVRENRAKAEDILAVHRELTSIRGQIESLEGRKKYLEQMTALSTVRLQIRPQAAPRTVIEERWNPLVTVSNAARALISVVRWFLSVFIYIVVLSPLLLVPLAVLWLIARWIRHRRRARADGVDA